MMESPLMQEILSENTHKNILEVLKVRFGEVPTSLEKRIRADENLSHLLEVLRAAAGCSDLTDFTQTLR